jgi:uncharacterized protein (TIGR03492 family)
MMRRALFVTNGHGEASIAERIAEAVRAADPALEVDHFPLVGEGLGGAAMREVGPRRTMPSGGLVAMGNVRAFARDLGAGFVALFFAQLRFLRGARDAYGLAVAVGDSYALALALGARLPTLFVGTAKSAYVAPYGPFERTLLRRARRVFVRDDRTAADLREHGVPLASAPGNVIVDLLRADGPALPGDWIGLLPGSREAAYADAVRLARVVRALGAVRPGVRALLSVAPTVGAGRLAAGLAADGWRVADGAGDVPFVASVPGAEIDAWSGGLGAFLRASRVAIGQAGTANEAAAACGVPVVALDDDPGPGASWYRMRQRRLLGEALEIVAAEPRAAAAAVAGLLADEPRLARMRAAGRERMGRSGGAEAIADEVVRVSRGSAAA